MVRRWAQLPTASSRPSASRAYRVRRNVDSKGIRPVTPSASLMAWSASAAHSAIAVNDRAPASTAQCQGQDHPQAAPNSPARPRIEGRRPAPAATAPPRRPRTAGRPPTGQRQGRSEMMTQRACRPSSDPAGVGTAMIASGAVPPPLPAHIAYRRPAESPLIQDFADTLGTWVRLPGRPGQSGVSASPTETPQLGDTAADPHRNPTDETAHSGTLVMRVNGAENSRSAASMRVIWAIGAFSR